MDAAEIVPSLLPDGYAVSVAEPVSPGVFGLGEREDQAYVFARFKSRCCSRSPLRGHDMSTRPRNSCLVTSAKGTDLPMRTTNRRPVLLRGVSAACGLLTILAAMSAAPATAVQPGTRPAFAVRSCATSIRPLPEDGSRLEPGLKRSGALLFESLSDVGPPLFPIGPDGNGDGRFFVIVWNVVVVGHDGVRISTSSKAARFAFRVSQFGSKALHLRSADRAVDLHPCASRRMTNFNGGVLVVDHSRCIPFSVQNLRTRRISRTVLAVGRSC
jgi:hypothetical protein